MMAARAGFGIGPGAGLPVARLPGRRWVRQAGQVIAGLLLTGLAAAALLAAGIATVGQRWLSSPVTTASGAAQS